MNPLEVCGHVNGNISVDCHTNDDIDTPSHETVEHGHHQMSMKVCGSV